MSSKELLLGALVGTEIQRMASKFEFYGLGTDFPKGESWVSSDSITLEQFLDKHPSPESAEQTTLYGIAWEFIWGKKPPEDVADAKNLLLIKSRSGMELTQMEQLWLKLIMVDTDMF